jgi:hypothetical protein
VVPVVARHLPSGGRSVTIRSAATARMFAASG